MAIRNGTPVTPQPWFENMVPGGTLDLADANRTNFQNGNLNSLFLNMDISRMIDGLDPINNYQSMDHFMRASHGKSNYHGLLLSLRKRLSEGLVYDINYTFSKSLDQLGLIQNWASVMPNGFDLDAEYGPSIFDFTHMFNTYWKYELPFRFDNPVLNQIISQWQVSGIFTARSGQPGFISQGTQVWGGGFIFGYDTAAVPLKDITGTYGNTVNANVTGSGTVGINGDPAEGGTGLNLFADPEAVFDSVRRVELSKDGRSGRGNAIRGLPHWNLDLSVAKSFSVWEGADIRFQVDFFNLFNKVDFEDPWDSAAFSLTNPQAFGVLSEQFVPNFRVSGSRWIQMGLRFDF
jgi:hypothetical protein